MSGQMDGKKLSEVLIEQCEIFYGKEILSEDAVLRDYAKFLTDKFFSGKREVLFTLHTGSLCFDVLSILVTSLDCIRRELESEEEYPEFQIDDIVVYKNTRYRWKGIKIDPDNGIKGTYCILSQDAKGKNGPTTYYVPSEKKNLIKPYYVSSVRTDGMGLRKKASNREDFLSFLFDVPQDKLPSVVDESAVVVCDRSYITDIVKNISIKYKDKHVDLEDICPTSYFTSSGEEYQIGVNQLKLTPVIRAAETVSSARDLILDRENKAEDLVIIGATSRVTEDTELEDLLNRKALNHINISGILNPVLGKYAVEHSGEKSIYACTKKYLKSFETHLNEDSNNDLVNELHEQEKNIIYSSISYEIVDGGWTWEQYKGIRNGLRNIQNSSWDERRKNQFVPIAYSLINLLNTAPFSMEYLEKAIEGNQIHAGVVSPQKRIEELLDLAEEAGMYQEACLTLIDAIDKQYKTEYSSSPKYDSMYHYIDDYFTKKSNIAIVVPKAYYADLLKMLMPSYRFGEIDIVTPSRFNSRKYYDGVLVVGNFKDKLFDPLNCKTAAENVSFLYENEKKIFRYKKAQIEKIDHGLNIAAGVSDGKNDKRDQAGSFNDNDTEIGDEIKTFEETDEAIDRIPFLDLPEFRSSQSSSGSSQAVAEVTVTGTFISGETILFTKYYKAVVYDPSSSKIVEKDPEGIVPGDILVFMSRDSYTKNTVDTIYDQLLSKGRFNNRIVEASEKAGYWKEALREYKDNNNLTNREVARRLRNCGSSIQEMAVRQWLADDSHIVGPRNEKTMEHIAAITEDPYISADPSSYFEACRLVRRERREILRLIGLAITEKLRGTVPRSNEILTDIWENIDKLSSELEVDRISKLNDPVTVPIGLVNKPIEKKENLL